jgi:hypothetical protein
MESSLNKSNLNLNTSVDASTNTSTDISVEIPQKNKISYHRKIPSNLRSVPKIFDRDFSGLYYDDAKNLFYSTHTKKRTRTFCPITWAQIKYNYIKKQNGVTNRIYKYLRIPLGDGSFFRLSEKEWEDWQNVNKPKTKELLEK